MFHSKGSERVQYTVEFYSFWLIRLPGIVITISIACLLSICSSAVTLADAQGAADLPGNDDSAQIVRSSDNTGFGASICKHRRNILRKAEETVLPPFFFN